MAHDAPIAMRERLILFTILATTGFSAYMLLNHNPPFTPHLLPMTPLDEATPFWVWTVWPYTLLWLSNFILPFCIRGRENFLQMAVTFVVALGILVVFWALWPTTFPRPPAVSCAASGTPAGWFPAKLGRSRAIARPSLLTL